jgi:hypothetical protein
MIKERNEKIKAQGDKYVDFIDKVLKSNVIKKFFPGFPGFNRNTLKKLYIEAAREYSGNPKMFQKEDEDIDENLNIFQKIGRGTRKTFSYLVSAMFSPIVPEPEKRRNEIFDMFLDISKGHHMNADPRFLRIYLNKCIPIFEAKVNDNNKKGGQENGNGENFLETLRKALMHIDHLRANEKEQEKGDS